MQIPILPRHMLLALVRNRRQLFRGRHIGVVAPLDAAGPLVHEPRHADHEKFIQIGARDRDKFQFFEQRIVRIYRLFQNAFVETQPAQFPIQKVTVVQLWHLLRPCRVNHCGLLSSFASSPKTSVNNLVSSAKVHSSKRVFVLAFAS